MTLPEIHAQCDKLIESRGAFSVPIAKSLKIALEGIERIQRNTGDMMARVHCAETLAAIAKEFE